MEVKVLENASTEEIEITISDMYQRYLYVDKIDKKYYGDNVLTIIYFRERQD